MTEPTCGNCRHWDRDPRDEWRGYCRRYPPMIPIAASGGWDTFDSGELLLEQPITYGDERCGEWREK